MTANAVSPNADAPPPHKAETNVKDTIESIIVAFILAFVFRCFVIEAFVIPTGSMAPTLLGAHMSFRCPDCGYRFTSGFGLSDQQTFSVPDKAVIRVNGQTTPKTFALFCPNCGYRLPKELKDDQANDATAPGVRYGDRILVMKYLYLLHEPKRWDVVVFKSPYTDNGDYSVNYIKRLIATPGESAFVAQGDIYIAPPSAHKTDADGNLLPLAPGDFVVQPKPRHVQDALWRIVFDADYVPIRQSRNYLDTIGRQIIDRDWQQPWHQVEGSGWLNDDREKGVDERTFRFEGQAGTLAFDPQANPTTSSLTDWLAYDQSEGQLGAADTMAESPYRNVRNVSDLKMNFRSSGIAGDGVLRVILSKIENKTNRTDVIAELSAAKARLLLSTSHGQALLSEQAVDLSRPHAISFENVDYRATLRIDGRDVLVSTEQQYAPSVQMVIDNRTRPPAGAARLEAENIAVTLTHLQLWRDIYYRDDGTTTPMLRASADNFPNKVATLGPDDFFTLGDNSYLSLDGRFWPMPVQLPGEGLDAPAGVVPRRFMLGKAFFVYWPAGFRPADSVPVSLIPNFGEMRFIR